MLASSRPRHRDDAVKIAQPGAYMANSLPIFPSRAPGAAGSHGVHVEPQDTLPEGVRQKLLDRLEDLNRGFMLGDPQHTGFVSLYDFRQVQNRTVMPRAQSESNSRETDKRISEAIWSYQCAREPL